MGEKGRSVSVKKRKDLGRLKEALPMLAKSQRLGKGLTNAVTIGSPPCSGQPHLSIEEIWEEVFEPAPNMVLILDRDFAIARANRAFARAFGVGQRELLGRGCDEIIRGAGVRHGPSPQKKARGRPGADEFYIARMGDCFLLSVSPLLSDSDRFIECVRVATDIITQKGGKRAPGPGSERLYGREGRQVALTPRQYEILLLLCEGRLVKEIAFQLKISARTVEFHKRKLMENAGVKTFAELIRYAVREHITT